MLFLRSWWENYVGLEGLSNEELAQKITLGSSEVEEVIMLKDIFDAKVLVGRIENVRKHENADRLNVFDINLGSLGYRQIVSAAPNVREGLIVPVALEGARLAYATIALRPMRGVESQGMCLGKSELLLETYPSEGLWELNEELQHKVPTSNSSIEVFFGQSICTVFPDLYPEETIFDIKVLPNRMSEIGHHAGMAREIAVLFEESATIKSPLQKLMNPDLISRELSEVIAKADRSGINFSLNDKVDYVQSFALFETKLSREYHLPTLYQKRMMLTGRNLVDSIADLTNYFLADFGQPTHVFGADNVVKDNSLQWVVDKTTVPVQFKGLGNLKDTILPSGIPILYDERESDNILALPAISGGESSKAKYEGKSFLFEIANFDGDDVAQASFDLKYRSDGAKMWSGGVNPALMAYTIVELSKTAAETGILLEICGIYDKSAHQVVTEQDKIVTILETYCTSNQPITIDWEYLSRRLDGRGSDYWKTAIEATLNRVGRVEGDLFYPNVFLSNIQTLNDVLEEVIRLVDYDDLQPHQINGAQLGELDMTFEALINLKKRITAFGFQEIITRPFVSVDDLESSDEQSVIRVLKPYNSTMPFVRDNLAGSLLSAISENIQRGEKDPLVFELGLIYQRNGNRVHAPRRLTLAGITPDPYVFTSAINQILQDLNIENASDIQDTGTWKTTENESGDMYSFEVDGTAIAHIREVANKVKKRYNIPLNKKLLIADVVLDHAIPEFIYNTYHDETAYPMVRRTYSLSIDKNISFKSIKTVISRFQTDATKIIVKPIERLADAANEHNDILNLDIIFISYDKTLSGDEIKSYEDQILRDLQSLGSVTLR